MWFKSLWNGIQLAHTTMSNLLTKGWQLAYNNAPQIIGGAKSVSSFVSRYVPAWAPVHAGLIEPAAEFLQKAWDYSQSRDINEDTGQLEQQ